MIDFGFDKIALIGAVALIVIGPERLPRVARTVGHLMGKAQRYVADVKAEVNRSIELEELKKMRGEFEDAARDVGHSINESVQKTSDELRQAWEGDAHSESAYAGTVPVYHRPRKNWRVKRSATPHWYKQKQGVRTKALSGAARVARYRPRASS